MRIECILDRNRFLMIEYIRNECMRGLMNEMARNKYPEMTVEKILDVSKRLFLEKGFDNTTIQDIVDGLDGLTKGAVYHHFKSKEEILDALGNSMFFEDNPFTLIESRTDLSGLEKMREVIRLYHSSREREELSRQSVPLLKNPRILAGMLESDRTVLAPLWLRLMEEGNRDGSIHTQFARELSQVIPMLTGLWLAPSVYPASKDEIRQKLRFIARLLESMGVPLVDDGMMALMNQILERFEGI